jgi:hypothetical protein
MTLLPVDLLEHIGGSPRDRTTRIALAGAQNQYRMGHWTTQEYEQMVQHINETHGLGGRWFDSNGNWKPPRG